MESDIKIKSEPTFLTKNETSDEDEEHEFDEPENNDGTNDTYYTSSKQQFRHQKYRQFKPKTYNAKQTISGSSSSNWRNHSTTPNMTKQIKGKNSR